MPGRRPQSLVRYRRADEGQLVWGSRAESCPAADRSHLPQSGQVLAGARHHARDDLVVDRTVVRAILPRRANQNLAGSPRLHVKRERVAGDGVGALQIPEFDELVAYETGISIGNNQMALAFPYLEAGCKLRRPCPRGIHYQAAADYGAVGDFYRAAA